MKKHTHMPPVLLVKAIGLWLSGRIQWPKDQNGKVLREDEDFIIFRKVVIRSFKDNQSNPVVLKVFFRFKRFSFKVNKILSLIPIPFIITQPGFISKTWLSGKQTGTFFGLYEWDNAENAKRYLNSFPLKMMKRRAIPESLRLEIIDSRKR